MPAAPTQRLSSPAKRRQATAASGGGLGLGLLLLIGGLVLHGHYEPVKQACDSGLGALGQALEPGAQSHCSLDSALAEAGTVATVIGGIILAGVLLTVIGLLLEARVEAGKRAAPARKAAAVSRPKPAAPAGRSDVDARGQTASKFKIVSTGDGLSVSAQQPDVSKDGGSSSAVQGVDAGVSAKRT
ncbi:MAG TPA: hypothetical protein VK790_01245 [Solirubrobacteraceae bacterium]|jgi:hypothetical protein|nr:hypothetical protein [Solirubrobacteraceae bacterium]